MTRNELIAAGLAGGATAGITLGLLYYFRVKRYREQAAQWTARGGEATQIRARLQAAAEPLARQITRQSAESFLASNYGITQERMQGVERLARALGV